MAALSFKDRKLRAWPRCTAGALSWLNIRTTGSSAARSFRRRSAGGRVPRRRSSSASACRSTARR
ncbi:hypothetical protein VAPA_2c03910 [Variovorax paradoxus B4]|uniref:Uncharacterized protein n=1 Tax=Variovorax paradoxus B4 TaxID=1246301 RepID=T1XK64_VARPD|nr:hypothetical protein VAPA_2c03910 [Variovorax paradoxus B4]